MRRAIELHRTVATTTGRKTGQCHCTKIWFINIDGRLYITDPLGGRDWYANPVQRLGALSTSSTARGDT